MGNDASISRRFFLKTAGAGVAAAGIAGVDAAPAATRVLGPGEVEVAFVLNGESRKLSVEPRATLLDALRTKLDLTGAKEVCGRGSCGACTVILDGDPVNACMLLAIDVEGREVTTVEGLGTPEALSPVQQAFVEHDALQCGFCTPGFVVAATALLEKNPSPTRAQIKEGLCGNLCRCGTYGRVFEAVESAASRRGGRKG